ncbi:MAG TPA: molybdopterin cofactor-binding domain-containing protein [Candidatus Acidoferrales bacterium]|nr:molybdopterin cofactor-binding domain-containing protein [Candidatus Acidoferrales bacterium]
MSEHPILPVKLANTADEHLVINSTAIEPERYELRSPALHHFELQRRDFFKILGAGLMVACVLKDATAFQESGRRGRGRGYGEELPKEIGAWLHIGENGVVTVYTGKAEVGQNIRTSLSQAVAEELRYPIAKIEMVMGDTKLTPFDMGTFGSRTTPTMNLQLRKVASAARDTLIAMAAKQWNCDAKDLVAEGGWIRQKSSGGDAAHSIEYAALVKGQQLTQTLPETDPLIPASQWTVEGTPVPKVDARDFVTGKHRYPSDQRADGMLHGKVLRPPSFGAKLISVEPPPANLMQNITFVHDGDFIGVAAPDVDTATRALAAIHAEWKEQPQISNKELFDYLRKNAAPRGDAETKGSMEAGLAAADHKLSQKYSVNYIAHCPLEPRAALAQWSDEGLTAWTGTQRPFGVREELMNAFSLSQSRVRVLMPDTGAAYGGKHTGEAAVEAARLARAANKPVKVVWTREEEFTWAYLRPAGVIEATAGVRNDGTITAWEFHNYNSGGAGIQTFYDIANQKIQFHEVDSPLRQGSYRALASTANHFARESFMDELAHEIGMDPLEFRMKNLTNDRLRAVFTAAAEKFGWGKSKPAPGHGYGMGGGYEKLGNVATCVELHVEQDTGEVKLDRIVCAFECGAIVNPDGLRNQVEGANIMGIGGALFEAIEFANGRILNAKFSKYRLPRFSDVPPIEVVLLDRKDLPSAGAGECPIVGLAPAIGNAIFHATGQRLRTMPMAADGLKQA